MLKKLLIGTIIFEMIVFVYFYSFEYKPKEVADTPSRLMESYVLKEQPSESVMNQTNLLSEDTSSPTNSIGLEQLLSRYSKIFKNLEEDTSKKVFNLTIKAFDEGQDRDLKTLSLAALTEYYQELKKIEDDTNAEFEIYYNQLRDELVEQGYPLAEAVEFKREYERKKEEQKKRFLEKLTGEKSSNQ